MTYGSVMQAWKALRVRTGRTDYFVSVGKGMYRLSLMEISGRKTIVTKLTDLMPARAMIELLNCLIS